LIGKGTVFDILNKNNMELQKRIQIKREKFDNILSLLISKNAIKVGYSYNNENVFLWGSESAIDQIRALADN
jgi:hypothetical protein